MKILKLKEEVKLAMKAKDKERLDSLRFLLSGLDNLKIELRLADVTEIGDSQLEDVVVKQLKLLNQEKESLINAKRDTSKVDNQIKVMNEFAPAYMSEADIEIYLKQKIVELNIGSIKEKGKLMGFVSKELKGKADLSLVNKIISKLL